MKTIQSIAFVLLLLASCNSTPPQEIKKEPCRHNEFISDYKGKEAFLMDTLFGEIDHACHRYRPYDKNNDGFIILLSEKGSDYKGPIILDKREGELYLFNKKMSSINSDSVRFDIDRLGNIREIFELFSNYGLYMMDIRRKERKIYVEFLDGKHLLYRTYDEVCRKSNDTIYASRILDTIYGERNISEDDSLIQRGWELY